MDARGERPVAGGGGLAGQAGYLAIRNVCLRSGKSAVAYGWKCIAKALTKPLGQVRINVCLVAWNDLAWKKFLFFEVYYGYVTIPTKPILHVFDFPCGICWLWYDGSEDSWRFSDRQCIIQLPL